MNMLLHHPLLVSGLGIWCAAAGVLMFSIAVWGTGEYE